MRALSNRVGQLRRLSTQPIRKGSITDHSMDYMVRYGLRSTAFLPQKGRLLPKSDTLYADLASPLELHKLPDHRIRELVQMIQDGKGELAYERFESLRQEDPTILQHLTIEQCTVFLRLMTTSPRHSSVYWPRAKAIASAMREAGHSLQPANYSRLITYAFHTGEHHVVSHLWQEVEEAGVEKTAALWNSYIRATCNGHPYHWTQMKRLDYKAKFDTELEPPVSNDALVLFKRMADEGVQPNATTYELLMYYFAKKEDLENVKTIAETVWGDKDDPTSYTSRLAGEGSVTRPEASTLAAILHSYGVNGRFTKGLKYATWLSTQYRIKMDNPKAYHYWTMALKWAFMDRATPSRVFWRVWRWITQVYCIDPTFAMYMLRLKQLVSYNDHRALLKEIPNILKSQNVVRKRYLGAIYLNRAARIMVQKGRHSEALRIVKKWAKQGDQFAMVWSYITRHMATSVKPRKGLQRRKRSQQ